MRLRRVVPLPGLEVTAHGRLGTGPDADDGVETPLKIVAVATGANALPFGVTGLSIRQPYTRPRHPSDPQISSRHEPRRVRRPTDLHRLRHLRRRVRMRPGVDMKLSADHKHELAIFLMRMTATAPDTSVELWEVRGSAQASLEVRHGAVRKSFPLIEEPCVRCGNLLGGGSAHGPGFCRDRLRESAEAANRRLGEALEKVKGDPIVRRIA